MKGRKKIIILFLCGLGAGVFPALPQSEPRPFLLVPSSSTYATGRAWDTRDTKNATSLTQPVGPLQGILSSINVSGGERSECNFPELDVSRASALAQADNLLRDPDRLRFKLHSSTAARGGHFVKCVACVFNNCVGLLPVNPSAEAFARASVSVDLIFTPETQLLPYDINILSTVSTTGGLPPDVRFRVVDVEGAPVAEGSAANQKLRIPGGPGLSYRISVDSVASSERSEKVGGETDLTIDVALAPLMENSDDPVIGGGEKTNLYPEVGALLLNSDGHCTGTLIGRKTVLTAAHCVYWYSPREMTFVVGPNYKSPTGRSAVTDVIYPQFDRDGFQFNAANMDNDIALVKLAEEFQTYYGVPEKLSSEPGVIIPGDEFSLSSILDQRKKLMLVGFGNRVVRGTPQDPGPKRRVPMPIFELKDTRFIYHTGGPGTCNGDSGGPALTEKNDSFLVQGIASTGDCRGSGSYTRVDHYARWIQDFLDKQDPAFVKTPISDPQEPAAPAVSSGSH